jgi:hypothetical protein
MYVIDRNNTFLYLHTATKINRNIFFRKEASDFIPRTWKKEKTNSTVYFI